MVGVERLGVNASGGERSNGGAMHERDDRFIAGIFNYCDRWCERCRFTDRCQVYEQEQRQWERHLLRGEDPDDPAVFIKDVEESLGEAIGMLAAMAEEAGIDLAAKLEEQAGAEPEAELPSRLSGPEAHPLTVRMERWSQRVGALLERMRTETPAIGQELARAAREYSEREQDATLEALPGARDAFELLGRYQFLVVVKTVRATGGLADAGAETPEELTAARWDDALGTAKLVNECLGKAGAALWQIAELHGDWQAEVLPLAAETEALRQEIDRLFPGHPAFRRPGLDDAEP
jgi:hypothetical protein